MWTSTGSITSKSNHVSMAVFNRDVTGYIQTNACTAAIAGCVNGQVVVNSFTYYYSLPQNLQNATIKGSEVAYCLFLDFLPESLSEPWAQRFRLGSERHLSRRHLQQHHQMALQRRGDLRRGPLFGPRLLHLEQHLSDRHLNARACSRMHQYARPRENLDASFNYTWNDHLVFSHRRDQHPGQRAENLWRQAELDCSSSTTPTSRSSTGLSRSALATGSRQWPRTRVRGRNFSGTDPPWRAGFLLARPFVR